MRSFDVMKKETTRVPRSYKIDGEVYEEAKKVAIDNGINLAQFVESVVGLFSSGVKIKAHGKTCHGKRITWDIVEDLKNANAKP